MALIGAAIVLSTIGIGPTLQETVKFHVATVPSSTKNATAPIAKVYDPNQVRVGAGLASMDLPMKAAILDGVLLPASDNTAVTFDCPTGNCTFTDPFTSMGICHTCVQQKITSHCGATVSENCNYTLPNGHFLNGQDTLYTINVSTAQTTNIVNSSPVAEVSIVTMTWQPDCTNSTQDLCATPLGSTGYSALGVECDLFFCTKSYETTISENVVNERILSLSPLPGQNASEEIYNVGGYIEYIADPCYIDGKPYNLTQTKQMRNKTLELMTLFHGTIEQNVTVPAQCVFGVYFAAQNSLQSFMTGNVGLWDGMGEAVYGMAIDEYAFFGTAVGVEPLFGGGNASFRSIDTVFEGLATAMTNHIRQTGSSYNITTAVGVLWQVQTVVVIEWYWIVLSVAVLVCSSIYLAAAIVIDAINTEDAKSWKWKSDPLALLSLGVKSTTLEMLDPLSSEKAMEKAAKQVKMRLVRTDGGWGFVEDSTKGTAREHESLRDAAA